jgi:hypothetical protein
MGIDEARHHDAICRASITCAFGASMLGLHRGDFLALDQNIQPASKSPTALSSESTQPALEQDRPGRI